METVARQDLMDSSDEERYDLLNAHAFALCSCFKTTFEKNSLKRFYKLDFKDFKLSPCRDEDGTPVYSEAAKELKKRIAHAASNNQQASNQGYKEIQDVPYPPHLSSSYFTVIF